MDKRYVINTDTDRVWHEVCDAHAPHVNDVGVPVARALPDMADLLTQLLNEHETAAADQRARIAVQLELAGFDGAARFVRTMDL